jgi:starch synthase
MAKLEVALLSREYPPEIYGGAGVHVEYLARALAPHVSVRVHCFGAERGAPEVARSYLPWTALDGASPELAALRTMSVDLAMAAGVKGAGLVHTHTWYANLGGHLAKLVHGVPHVMTTHSLEPLRPWKAEQLRGGYALSSFCEKTAILSADAVIAVCRAE